MAINPATGVEDPSFVPPPSTGIIDSNIPAAPAASTTPTTGVGTTSISGGSVSDQLNQILGPSTTPSTTTPTNWNVTPEQTVQGQIGGIINSNSPLRDRANARSMEAANSKGLINSSMAVQAGEAALYDAALPIAQQDAATQAQAAQFNVGTSSQFALAAQAQGFNLKTMSAQQLNTMEQMAKAQGFNLETLSAQQVNDLAKASILQGYDLTKMDKQASDALNLLGATTLADITKMAKAQGFNLETMNAQQVNDLAKAAVLQDYDLTKMNKAASDTLKLLDATTLADITKMTTANGFDLAKMDAQQINDLAKMSVDNRYKMDLLKTDNENKILLAGMDNTNRIDLANIQADYQTLLGTNKTAADVFTSVLTNITAIQNDPKIDGVTVDANDGKTPKDRAIDLQMNMLRGSFSVIGGIAGIDVEGLLGFNTDSGAPPSDGIMAGAVDANTTNNNAGAANDLAAGQAAPTRRSFRD